MKNIKDIYHVKFTKDAKSDLTEIYEFIAQQNPQTVVKKIMQIKEKADTLDHFPYRGSYVPELLKRNIKDYRQITEPPWKIIYRVDGKTVYIMKIIDSRRNLQDILIKKLVK